MELDPRALRTFLAVCRAKSISAAARRLHISQPSVSVSITQLERVLGASLFARARSGITLTAAGVALMRRAEAMEHLLAGAPREVALARKGLEGPLVIGGTPGALASLIPKAVGALREAQRRFELQILERPDNVLVDLLRAERIDLAIVTTGLEAVPPDIAEEGVLRDPFDLIVGRHNDELPARVALADLADRRWVLPDAVGAFRRQVDAVFIATGASTPQEVIRCDSLLTTKAIVRNTDYMTVLPRQVVAAELSIGVLRAVEIEGARFLRTVGVRRVTGRQLAPLAEAFLDTLRSLGRNA
jgi:LysR family transcriptional regulator of abg operon